MNKLLTFGLLGAAIYGAVRLIQMKNVADSITMRLVNPRIHRVDGSGVVFFTEVAINNPSRDTLTITKPVVTLSSNGSVIAQSPGQNNRIRIAPLSVTTIDTIQLALPWLSLAGFAAGVIQRLPAIIAATRNGGDITRNVLSAVGIPLEMSFSTYAGGIFFQSPSVKLI